MSSPVGKEIQLSNITADFSSAARDAIACVEEVGDVAAESFEMQNLLGR